MPPFCPNNACRQAFGALLLYIFPVQLPFGAQMVCIILTDFVQVICIHFNFDSRTLPIMQQRFSQSKGFGGVKIWYSTLLSAHAKKGGAFYHTVDHLQAEDDNTDCSHQLFSTLLRFCNVCSDQLFSPDSFNQLFSTEQLLLFNVIRT